MNQSAPSLVVPRSTRVVFQLLSACVLAICAASASAQLDADFNAMPTTGGNPLVVSFTDTSTGGSPTTWLWSFGDGSTSSDQHPTHTYLLDGTFTVKLSVFQAIPAQLSTKVKTNLISVNPLPVVVGFTATPSTGANPLSVSFTDTTTGAVLTGWSWDFGDGNTSTLQSPTAVYDNPGTYSVSLTTSVGLQDDVLVKTNLIMVDPAPIVVDFTASVITGTNPLSVSFVDTSTGAAVDAWNWSFGDGNNSTLQNPSHAYDLPGTFSVSLTTLIGQQQDTLTQVDLITVDPAPLVADFDTLGFGLTTLPHAFSDTTLGAVTGWSWDFGDGQASSLQEPTHKYDDAGTYSVSLTAFIGLQGDTFVQPIVITDPMVQQAYLKASNTDQSDQFGISVSVSGDTAVVGADYERSTATGVNGDETDNSAFVAGAAYVFLRAPSGWNQQAYLKASNTELGDAFGTSVSVSGDTIVVGAPSESSNAIGVNGNQSNNSAEDAGAAYVFVRNGGSWVQEAYLKPSNTGASDNFGESVAIAGNTIVVGASFEDGLKSNSGAAYVFVRNGTTWTQQAKFKSANPDVNDHFGASVAISGNFIVVGASLEDTNAVGVNQAHNNDLGDSGAAYIFIRNGPNWSQHAFLKASNPDFSDRFGNSVSVSGDTVLVGAWREQSSATGVDGNQNDNSLSVAGAAYVFERNGPTWSQTAYLKASNTFLGNFFGLSVAVSGDRLLVGAGGASGAVHAFARNGTSWIHKAYIETSNAEQGDSFGAAVAASGNTLIFGAAGEDSSATGVNGDESSNGASASGAAYVFDPFAWGDLGGGTSGIAGLPILRGSGALTSGSILDLDLSMAPPTGLVMLRASAGSIPTPVNVVGGTLFAQPFDLQVLLVTNPQGEISLAGLVAPGLPPGIGVAFQYIVQDLTAFHGVTLSNAVTTVTP